MNKFDISSAKYIGLILLICLIFILVVAHAYTYIPQKDNSNRILSEQILDNEQPREDNSVVDDEEEISEDEETDMPENKEQEQGKKPDYKNIEPLAPVKDDELIKNEVSETSADSVEKVMSKAETLRSDNDLEAAITEYKKAITLTENVSVQAQCYENIAEIYAYSKRYGSAMAAAQKAYNMEPTVSRDVLLARLYYKTGNVDKANYRMNNILKTEFTK